MENQSFGRYFDDPDSLFNWLDDAVLCMSAGTLLNRSGVTADLLQQSASAADLAARNGLPADKLARILDFFAGHGVIERDDDGTYRANGRTKALHNAAGYLATIAVGSAAGSKLLPALQQGDVTPFELHYGEPVFEWFPKHPVEADAFADMMGWMTRRTQPFILANHRFEPFETVVDIGGSKGDLLLGIMDTYPGTKGILFDLPDVVEFARPIVEASPHADRVELVGGSFFEAVPSADLYTMKQILHDWHDDECKQILSSIRAAIRPGGRLAVMDHLLGDTPQPDEAQATDIAMMIWDTGRERRQADFEALFAATGWRLERITRNPTGHSVIEAVPV